VRNANSDPDGYANSDTCRNAYSYGYGHSDSKTESNSETCSDPQEPSYSAAAPIGLL
jgi:hypothetical protein